MVIHLHSPEFFRRDFYCWCCCCCAVVLFIGLLAGLLYFFRRLFLFLPATTLLSPKKMSLSASEMLILYGSETGTAEEVAFRLHRMIASSSTTSGPAICSLADYDVKKLPTERLVVFVVSTTGDGDVPGSMKAFWRFLLLRSLPANSLENLSFATFGLGDSSYEKFNATARKLNKRLHQLSAKEVLPMGLGDDQDRYGYFTVLDEWSKCLLALFPSSTMQSSMATVPPMIPNYTLQILDSINPSSSGEEVASSSMNIHEVVSRLLPPPYDVKQHRSSTCRSADNRSSQSLSLSPLPIIATVRENTRMTSENWDQDVRHIVLSLPVPFTSTPTPKENIMTQNHNPNHNFDVNTMHVAGDVATICPRNEPTLVQRMLNIVCSSSNTATATSNTASTTATAQVQLNVNLKPDSMIRLYRRSGSIPRKSRLGDVSQCQLQDLFSMLLDISGIPQRSFFDGLAMYATNEDEKEKLLEIASAEGTDLYYDYCIKEKRNYVEVMEDFVSSRPSLIVLLDFLPLMQPRHYSIANSGRAYPNEIHLCVAVATTKTPYGRRKTGLCSGFLSRLTMEETVLVWVRKGAFSLDKYLSPTSIAANSASTLLKEKITLPLPPPSLSTSILPSPSTSSSLSGPSTTPHLITTLILVGPGTGVAPMRSILQERLTIQEPVKPPRSVLFFGCRKQQNDFLYEKEWSSLARCNNGNNGDATDDMGDAKDNEDAVVITAFSRDQPQKIYVTDKIRQHGSLVWSLLNPNTIPSTRSIVFVSGAAKRMPADVRQAFCDVICTYGENYNQESAGTLLQQMEKEGRYIVEAWS